MYCLSCVHLPILASPQAHIHTGREKETLTATHLIVQIDENSTNGVKTRGVPVVLRWVDGYNGTVWCGIEGRIRYCHVEHTYIHSKITHTRTATHILMDVFVCFSCLFT